MSGINGKKVVGYEDYYVTEGGDVYSTKLHQGSCGPRKLKPAPNHKGYLTVSLRNGGGQKSIRVHRLVAFAFIVNPDGKPAVNHKNGIKTDNRVINLEWVTDSENKLHSYQELGRVGAATGKFGEDNPLSEEVVQMDVDGNETRRFPSASDAGRAGFDQSNVSSCCRGVRKTHGGFRWKLAH